MATSNPSLVRDNSTLAHFIQWASAISTFMGTAGWLQSGDTGQVNWSTVSVPAVNTFVYEIWQPNDSLTPFYLRLDYGTGSGSSNTQPMMKVSIGTSTNGAGILGGFLTQVFNMPLPAVTVSSTSTQFSCFFSGEPGRIGILMWTTDVSNNGPMMFAVQRSLNNSGTPTSAFVTLFTASGSSGHPCFQQSLLLAAGAGNYVNPSAANAQFICLKANQFTSDTAFGSIAFSPVFPDIGYFGNPHDQVCVGSYFDFADSTTFTIGAANMSYGISHVYISAKNAPLDFVGDASGNSVLLMRWD